MLGQHRPALWPMLDRPRARRHVALAPEEHLPSVNLRIDCIRSYLSRWIARSTAQAATPRVWSGHIYAQFGTNQARYTQQLGRPRMRGARSQIGRAHV